MGLSAAAQVLRSFQWAKDSELRIKWTAGLTGLRIDGWVASGKPCSPSTTAMRRSLKPRWRNSLKTFSQHLAPSVCSIHRPSTSEQSSAPMPNARDTALFLTLPSSRIRSRSASRDNGRHRFKRARLPLFHFSQHFIGEGRNEIRRDFKSVQLEQMPANLTHAHPTCIHADHMIFKARQAPLIFGNERRLKRGKPVSRNIQRSITRRRDHGLRAAAVTMVTRFSLRALFSKRVVQFSLQHPLRQPFLQLTCQSRFA